MIHRTVALAVAITASQIRFAAYSSARSDPAGAWQSLYQFDSGHFRTVVEAGYFYPAEPRFEHAGNVACFPGYPLLTRGVIAVTGWPPEVALLVAAQLSCVGFWIYFLLVLAEWNVPIPRDEKPKLHCPGRRLRTFPISVQVHGRGRRRANTNPRRG